MLFVTVFIIFLNDDDSAVMVVMACDRKNAIFSCHKS